LVQAEPVRLLVVEALKVQKVRSVELFRRLAVARERILGQKEAMARQVEEAVVVQAQEFQSQKNSGTTAGPVHSVTLREAAEAIRRSEEIRRQPPEELVETA
jgi:hypothetical protein